MYLKATPEQISKRISQKTADLEEVELQITEILIDLKDLEPSLKTEAEFEKVVKDHIKQLKTYNELKDIAMQMMGIIADQRHLRLEDIMEEIDVEYDS